MARIGVMTFLHNDNVGSILQAWALQRTLEELGHDAEAVDYRPSRGEKVRNLLHSGNSPRLILEGARKRGVRSYGETSELHEQFAREHLKRSALCPNHAALRAAAQKYDLLVCGSDQIWSPVWLNPAYFLDFTDKPRVAYAPSLGVRECPGARKRRLIAKLVEPFSWVSVREEEGATLLESITGTRPVVLPDPALLPARETWLALAEEAPKEPYLLCYFLGDSEARWQTVKTLSERLRLPAWVIPKTQGAYQSGLPLLEGVSPQKWLGLLAGASHIVTDSFHGAAFACVLNRPFTLVRRYREDDPESKNSRVDQLLRLLEISDTEHPEWDRVNARLSSERERAMRWLAEATGAETPLKRP